jgi:hypothetical protein
MKPRLPSFSKLWFVIALGIAFAIGAVQTIQPTFARRAEWCGNLLCSASEHCCSNGAGLLICVKKHIPCPPSPPPV